MWFEEHALIQGILKICPSALLRWRIVPPASTAIALTQTLCQPNSRLQPSAITLSSSLACLWLFQIEGPFCGCPYNESWLIIYLGSIRAPGCCKLPCRNRKLMLQAPWADTKCRLEAFCACSRRRERLRASGTWPLPSGMFSGESIFLVCQPS